MVAAVAGPEHILGGQHRHSVNLGREHYRELRSIRYLCAGQVHALLRERHVVPDLEQEGEVGEPVQRAPIVKLVKILEEPGPGAVVVGAAVAVVDHLPHLSRLREVRNSELRIMLRSVIC